MTLTNASHSDSEWTNWVPNKDGECDDRKAKSIVGSKSIPEGMSA